MATLLGIAALSAPALLGGCGFTADMHVKSDKVWTEIHTGGATSPPQVATPKPALRPAIVAVFDIEARGLTLSAELREGLSAYVAMTLATSPRFHVVPRAQLKKRLRGEKRASYRQCFDPSCQIEIGRELAAQKTLATVVIKVGNQCTASAVLYDLRQATSEGGATVESKCSDEAIVAAVKTLVGKLAQARPR